jgi:2-hydroxychromene-2-carboxylate isomerase
MTQAHAKPTIEFWFEFASTYSYLSAMRIDALAQAAGVTVEWKPFLLGPIFGAQGWQTSPFNIFPDKGAHMWRDMERRTAALGLAFVHPDPFPQNSLLAARLTMVGLSEGWGEAFARGVYEVEFAHGLNIASERVLEGILMKVGADPGEAFERAESPQIKQALKDQTAEAIAKHVFGAPTFIVANGSGEEELFWGDDHLEQVLEWAHGRHPAQSEIA